MATLWELIKAIPSIISLAREVFDFIKGVFGDTPEKFLRDAGEAFSQFNKAKTDEEKANALRAIQSLIKRT